MTYLVPGTGSGLPGVVAAFAHRRALLFAALMFLVFSGLAHYWRLRVPVTRWAWEGAEHSARSARAGPSRTALAAVALALSVVGAAGAALALRAYIVEPYRVIGGSMLPTLEPDDQVGGRKGAYAIASGRLPARGDVVVFGGAGLLPGTDGSHWPDVLVKRVIGLPGDLVAMRGGAPVINGWTVPWCDAGEYVYVIPDATGSAVHGRLRVEFLDDRAYLTVHTMGAPFKDAYRVRPGEVFVLGDDRGNSLDSRAYDGGRGGGVPLEAIRARADWFLVGTHRSGDADWSRLLRPLDALQTRLRLEGVGTRDLEEGIARCLRERPVNARPPAPDGASSPGASHAI
jgi:signal peptidase I